MQQLRILTAGELLGICCPVLYKPSPYCHQQFSSTSLWPLFVFGQENIQADARMQEPIFLLPKMTIVIT